MDKVLHLKDAKTKDSQRSIALPETLSRRLITHRAKQAESKLAAGEAYDDEGFVFANPLGNPVRPVAYTKHFKSVIRDNQFGNLDLHSLQHCHASQLIAANINIKTISQRLGHFGIGITLDTYGHLLEGMDAKAAAVINASLI